ncbi:MAG: class I SAM-dependent methyltransferase [Rhodothermales bacterium]|nr:class I SAM-dependent methyltransferase [Rhodothermales bacterium]
MKNLLKPYRFKLLASERIGPAGNLLDVGCGSHSPTITRKWLPGWKYYGVDRENYGNDEADFGAMEAYYEIDLSNESLAPIPDHFFDVIVMSHVVEHLPNGLEVIRELTSKMKSGGRFYLEFPSVRSLHLPSMTGTLNFCDDETHVRVYSVAEVANTLLTSGFRIARAGTRRDWLRIFLLPIMVPVKYVLRREFSAGDFWDITGFASYVLAVKR